MAEQTTGTQALGGKNLSECDFEYVRWFVVVLCLRVLVPGIANRQSGLEGSAQK